MSLTGVLTAAVAAGFSTPDDPVIVYTRPGGKIHATPACSRLARRPGDEIILTVAEVLGLADTAWCQSCPDLTGPWAQLDRACAALSEPNRFANADTSLAWQHVAAQANVARFAAIAASSTSEPATVTRAAALAAAARHQCVSLAGHLDTAARIRRAALLSVGPWTSYGGHVPLLHHHPLCPPIERRNRQRRYQGSNPSRTYVTAWNRFAAVVFADADLDAAAHAAVVAGLDTDRTGSHPIDPDQLQAELVTLARSWADAVAAAARGTSLVTVFIHHPSQLASAHTELITGFDAAHTTGDAMYINVPAVVASVLEHSWYSGSSRPMIVATDAYTPDVLAFAARLYDPSDSGRLADPADAAYAAATIGVGCP